MSEQPIIIEAEITDLTPEEDVAAKLRLDEARAMLISVLKGKPPPKKNSEIKPIEERPPLTPEDLAKMMKAAERAFLFGEKPLPKPIERKGIRRWVEEPWEKPKPSPVDELDEIIRKAAAEIAGVKPGMPDPNDPMSEVLAVKAEAERNRLRRMHDDAVNRDRLRKKIMEGVYGVPDKSDFF